MHTTRFACSFLFVAIASLGGCASSDEASIGQGIAANVTYDEPRRDEIIVTDEFPKHEDRFLGAEAFVEGDVLVLTVRYGGGCQRHDIGLYWNGTVVETFPPQVDLALRHDAKGDLCEALLWREMRFDLSAIRESADGPVVINIDGAGVDTQVRLRGEPLAAVATAR